MLSLTQRLVRLGSAFAAQAIPAVSLASVLRDPAAYRAIFLADHVCADVFEPAPLAVMGLGPLALALPLEGAPYIGVGGPLAMALSLQLAFSAGLVWQAWLASWSSGVAWIGMGFLAVVVGT